MGLLLHFPFVLRLSDKDASWAAPAPSRMFLVGLDAGFLPFTIQNSSALVRPIWLRLGNFGSRLQRFQWLGFFVLRSEAVAPLEVRCRA